jgi:hypothetical protein
MAARDYSERDLEAAVRAYPVEWYVLNNTYLDWSRGRRFGPLNRFAAQLPALPHPLDRILDNLTGARDRRLCVPAAPGTQQILQRAKPADDPGESANGAEEALAARKVGDLVGVHVIPRPADDVGGIFPID